MKKKTTQQRAINVFLCVLLIVSMESVQRHTLVLSGIDILVVDMVRLITVYVVLFVLMCVHMKTL
jgi:hypothetical protein